MILYTISVYLKKKRKKKRKKKKKKKKKKKSEGVNGIKKKFLNWEILEKE